MRRLIIMLSLAVGLTLPVVLAGNAAARPFDPAPGVPGVAGDPVSCTNSSATTIVPGGVYRAMVEELRQQGYSTAEIQAELGQALVVPASGSAERCRASAAKRQRIGR